MAVISAISCFLFLVLSVRSQAQPAGEQYQISVDDPTNALGVDRQLVLANLSAAIDEWTRHIPKIRSLQTEIRVVSNTDSGRFSGRAESAVWYDYNGQRVLEECTTHKLRTGEDTNGSKPDVLIELQPDFMRKSYWIDPKPWQRTMPVPRGKIDLVTVFAHEFGHALGINGRLNRMTGQLPAGASLSQFDSHIVNAQSNEPAFRGAATNAVYGGDLPLTHFNQGETVITFTSRRQTYRASTSKSQNFYHYGRYTKSNESPLSLFGLMAGAWPYPDALQGLRIPVGELDVAILRDLGVPIR
jgi:hypothetical protein